MLPNNLKVHKTVFIKDLVWYLTIVTFKGIPACFWSHHKRTGMSDEQAKTAFEREHFKEVGELVADKMKRDLVPEMN